jgi:hypothetical protein
MARGWGRTWRLELRRRRNVTQYADAYHFPWQAASLHETHGYVLRGRLSLDIAFLSPGIGYKRYSLDVQRFLLGLDLLGIVGIRKPP